MAVESLPSRLLHSPHPGRAAALLLLAALAWSTPAFCGAIHDAARDGDLAKVQALLKDHPDAVSSKDDGGATPLHFAALKGHKDVAEFLLANKADANAQANNGATPLHLAAAMGHKEIAELLLAAKADINAQTNDGLTPLHLAVSSSQQEMTEFLLANKADVNATDFKGRTPLRAADEAGNDEMAEILRKHGARE